MKLSRFRFPSDVALCCDVQCGYEHQGVGVSLTLQSYRGQRSGGGDPRAARSLARSHCCKEHSSPRENLSALRFFASYQLKVNGNWRSFFFELRSNCCLFYSSFSICTQSYIYHFWIWVVLCDSFDSSGWQQHNTHFCFAMFLSSLRAQQHNTLQSSVRSPLWSCSTEIVAHTKRLENY